MFLSNNIISPLILTVFFMKFFEEKELRVDGRKTHNFRNVEVLFGHDNVNGYVDYKQGLTHVKVTLVQPDDKSIFKCSFTNLQKESISERQIYQFKYKLEQIYTEIYSSTACINLSITVVESGGSLFSTLVNAISLCLSYNGVNICDFPVSITYNENLDLCTEEQNDDLVSTIVHLVNTDRTVFFETCGQFQKNDFTQFTSIAVTACNYLYTILTSHFQQTIQTSQ